MPHVERRFTKSQKSTARPLSSRGRQEGRRRLVTALSCLSSLVQPASIIASSSSRRVLSTRYLTNAAPNSNAETSDSCPSLPSCWAYQFSGPLLSSSHEFSPLPSPLIGGSGQPGRRHCHRPSTAAQFYARGQRLQKATAHSCLSAPSALFPRPIWPCPRPYRAHGDSLSLSG